MNTCTRCPQQARWRDADGRNYCAGHVPANGKPLARMAAPEIDIVDRLEAWSGAHGCSIVGQLCMEAAAEIRRLRALVEAG
jgi:hypothetical protein